MEETTRGLPWPAPAAGKLGIYSANNVEHMLMLKAVDAISATVGELL